MDSGVALRRSLRLAGLPPSTSPPLGERNRQSKRTTSRIDSHTMGDHEDEIPELSSPPHEVGKKILLLYMILHLIYLHTLGSLLHMIYLHTSGMIPHSQVVGIGCRATRLIMNLRALVMLVMACLVSLHMIQHIMLSQNLILELCLGTFQFLSMRRDLGARVTLHPPSQRWRLHHMFILDLVLAALFRY